jgi:hypothetical protein
MQTSTLWRALAASILTVTVAACGGGGGGGSAVGGGGGSAPAAQPTATGGTAAVGAPLANAAVSLLCNAGGTPVTATTNAAGKYTASLPADCAAPYIFKATGTDPTASPTASITLYGFADAAANINITPFTDVAARLATSNDPAAAYAAVAAGSKKASDYWNAAALANAKAKIASILSQLGMSDAGITDILHQKFNAQVGDQLDGLLDTLKTKRGEVSLAVLAETVVQAGGSPTNQPWATLFPTGVNTIVLNGLQCNGGFSGGNIPSNSAATMTLTRGVNTLSVKASAVGIDFPEFVIGAAGTSSNYDMTVSGGSSERNGNSSFNISTNERNNNAFKTQNAQSALDTPSAVQVFSIYSSTNSYYSFSCQEVSNPITRDSLQNFYPQARMAAVLASSPATTITNSCENYDYFNETYIEYNYALSALGELKFDDVAVPANWLSDVTQPVSPYFRNSYYERFNRQPFGTGSTQISVNTNKGQTMSLYREANPQVNLNHSCYYD